MWTQNSLALMSSVIIHWGANLGLKGTFFPSRQNNITPLPQGKFCPAFAAVLPLSGNRVLLLVG